MSRDPLRTAALSSPRRDPAPADALGPVAGLLDLAHAELPSSELAPLLIALEEPAGRLAAAQEAADAPIDALSPTAQAVLVPIERLLHDASDAAPPDVRARVGDWLTGYLHEVAARPRGAAVVDAPAA